MGRILVIRGGAIGDFILTLPVLAALRGRFPGNRLAVLGYPQVTGLALAAGLADETRPLEGRALAGFFARAGLLDPAVAEWFGGFDLVISYLYDPDGIFRENVARCGRAQFLAGPHRPEEPGDVHAARAFLRPLEALAIFDADDVPRLSLARAASARAGTGRPLALHPGSGAERKNWPEPAWRGLIGVLAAEPGGRLLIVGGEAEGGRLERLAGGLDPARHAVRRSVPLVELVRDLADCTAFVGHDSGITHLAAALDVPCVVLWGPSNPRVWRPLGPRVELVRDERNGLAGLSVKAVIAALRRAVETVG